MPNSVDAPLAYTIKEYADLTRFGESTIRKRIASGDLRAVKRLSNYSNFVP